MTLTETDWIDGLDKLNSAKKSWGLSDDGKIIKTDCSLLQPVIYQQKPAMLKIALSAEERRATYLMLCWNGNGAAKIFEHEDDRLLMERAVGPASLKQMAISGLEDEANRIICGVASKLHGVKCSQVTELVPLPVWFSPLRWAANKHAGILTTCNEAATNLLNNPIEQVALHGDIHYDNVLDSGTRGWIAVDPKGLFGERGFDFANIYCNPDFKTAASPARLSKQVKLIATEARLEPKRLLNWTIAWSGLSAAFCMDDSEDAKLPLTVAEIALKELNNF